MGDEYKTELETELEKALEPKGYFCLDPSKQVLTNMARADFDEMPDVSEYSQLHDEFVPDDLKKFLEPRVEKSMREFSKKLREKSSVGGKAGEIDALMNMFLDIVLSDEENIVLKRKEWEVKDYLIKHRIQYDATEQKYAMEHFELHRMNKYQRYQKVFTLLIKDNKIDISVAWVYNEGEEDRLQFFEESEKKEIVANYTPNIISEEQLAPFEKYKKGDALDTKEFVKDLMELIGC